MGRSTTRTTPAKVAEAIRFGGIFVASLEDRIVRSAPFGEVAPDAASQLAIPCEFLGFRKPLAGASGELK